MYSFPNRGKEKREKRRASIEKTIARIGKSEKTLSEMERVRESDLSVLRVLRKALAGDVVSMDGARGVLAGIREAREWADAGAISIKNLRQELAELEEELILWTTEDLEATEKTL